ncbi:hypothetical protein N0B51_13585 [Tsuneonella sp. YG55]|uniref:Uncharacterized protein n=1 Tax=Tsuneonella litorea TaxID=2976475 RepID=A0A9X3AAK2_9SPHN|nr:hypothetical protein [Tsuneonella litorea]MCT2560010.1 hypothetical protein [Tsuneonella litorea]
MAGITDQPSPGPDRRGGERRETKAPFAGDDRRSDERRSGSDRRARTRFRLIN